jgi:hypothetical protein
MAFVTKVTSISVGGYGYLDTVVATVCKVGTIYFPITEFTNIPYGYHYYHVYQCDQYSFGAMFLRKNQKCFALGQISCRC